MRRQRRYVTSFSGREPAGAHEDARLHASLTQETEPAKLSHSRFDVGGSTTNRAIGFLVSHISGQARAALP